METLREHCFCARGNELETKGIETKWAGAGRLGSEVLGKWWMQLWKEKRCPKSFLYPQSTLPHHSQSSLQAIKDLPHFSHSLSLDNSAAAGCQALCEELISAP